MLLEFGPVHVYLGHQSGKYPDGNQVLVHGSDLCVAFDTPLASRQRTELLAEVDLVILGHVPKKKEKELIYINIKELEELKIFNIMELIIERRMKFII